MLIKLENRVEINFEAYGQGERLILLHGWGLDLHTFDKVTPTFSKALQVISLDLPGFGLSPRTEKPLSISDYAKIVDLFLKEMEIDKCFLLGHSFGGAVALNLASTSNKVRKLILVDSSGIRRRNFLTLTKILVYKAVKKLMLPKFFKSAKNLLGSADYKAAGPMLPTFLKVVNEDLTYLLPKISSPTLLVWGENDKETTISEAREISSGIKNSSLTVLNKCGHFPYLENPDEFTRTVLEFLNKI